MGGEFGFVDCVRLRHMGYRTGRQFRGREYRESTRFGGFVGGIRGSGMWVIDRVGARERRQSACLCPCRDRR